jgi:hypothetical protein
VHYSSERLSVFLTGLSLALLSRGYLGSDRYLKFRMFALGVITAAMCFSKLQAAPIALTLALAAFLHAWLARRGGFPGAACLILGAAAVPVAFSALFLYNGVFDEFWQSYVAQNLAYSDLTGLSLPTKMLAAVWMFLMQGEFRWYHVGLVLCGLVVLLDQQRRRRPALPRPTTALGLIPAPHRLAWHDSFGHVSIPLVFSLVLLVVSMYAVAKPGNPFQHYLLFLLTPWTLCVAVGILWAPQTDIPPASKAPGIDGQPARRRSTLLRADAARLFVLLAFGLPTVLRIATEEPASYEYFPRYDPHASSVVRLAQQYASEREFLVVWGWRPELYVKTNMLQGTRFGESVQQIEPTERVGFFRRQYLRDFVAADPPLFFDAVGPGSFRYEDRVRAGHETFPELARLIQARYVLVADGGSIRIYVRKDRWRCCPRL